MQFKLGSLGSSPHSTLLNFPLAAIFLSLEKIFQFIDFCSAFARDAAQITESQHPGFVVMDWAVAVLSLRFYKDFGADGICDKALLMGLMMQRFFQFRTGGRAGGITGRWPQHYAANAMLAFRYPGHGSRWSVDIPIHLYALLGRDGEEEQHVAG